MLTEQESLMFLKKEMKKDKGSGPDGYTKEVFNFFLAGSFVTRVRHYSYDQKMFSEQNKLGIITCIPQAGKPNQFKKNWRHINLLNVVYKLASGCLAERIKGFFDKIIHCNQTIFMKGKFMSKNIRFVYDIMHYTDITQVPLLLMLTDFDKAIDVVSWNVILDALHFF